MQHITHYRVFEEVDGRWGKMKNKGAGEKMEKGENCINNGVKPLKNAWICRHVYGGGVGK